MAVFLPEFQAGNTPPDNPLFAVPSPGAALVGRTALSADQQFAESVLGGILPLLRLAGLLHHLPLAGPAGHLRLCLIEHIPGDNRRMIIFHINHGKLAGVPHNLFADAVHSVRFLQQGVPHVTLIRSCQAWTHSFL